MSFEDDFSAQIEERDRQRDIEAGIAARKKAAEQEALRRAAEEEAVRLQVAEEGTPEIIEPMPQPRPIITEETEPVPQPGFTRIAVEEEKPVIQPGFTRVGVEPEKTQEQIESERQAIVSGGLTEEGRRLKAAREAAAAAEEVARGGLTEEGRRLAETPEAIARKQKKEEARGANIARGAIARGDTNIVVRTAGELKGAQDFLAAQEALIEAEKPRFRQATQEEIRGGLTEFGKELAGTAERQALKRKLEAARGAEKARTGLLTGKEIIVSTEGEEAGAKAFIEDGGQNILKKQAKELEESFFGGLTDTGKERTAGDIKREFQTAKARGFDKARNALLRGGEIVVVSAAEQEGAKEFIESKEGQAILLERAEQLRGGLTPSAKKAAATAEGKALTEKLGQARGRDIAINSILRGKEDIFVKEGAQTRGAETFLREVGLLAEPEPKKTTVPTTVIPSPREKTFVEGFEGTLTGDILKEAERQRALAAKRSSEGNTVGAFFAGVAGELLSLDAGIVGVGESLLELVGGKDVPDIGGALIGSGIESALSGEIRETPEATFLKTNPAFAAGAVLGEIILGVGIGAALKTGAKGVAKGAAAVSKIGTKSKVGKITSIPIKTVERLGIGGSKAEKVTKVTQKGEIIQVSPGKRVSKIVTTIDVEPKKLTFREAEELKDFAKRTEAIGIEVFGKETRGIKAGQEGLIKVRKGLFDFTGPGVTKRITGAKKFKVKKGLEDISVQRQKLQDELIDISSDVTADFTSRRSRALKAIDEFTSITTKRTAKTDIAGLRKLDKITVFDETARFKKAAKQFDTIEVVNKKFVFDESLKKLKTIQITPKKPSVKGLSLLEKERVGTVFDVVGKTKKIPKKRTLRSVLGPSKRGPKPTRTTIISTGEIKGAGGLEDIIRFERTGKARGIIGREIKKGDPIFKLPPIKKPPKIPGKITVQPKPRIKVPSEIIIRQPRKLLTPSRVGRVDRRIAPTKIGKKPTLTKIRRKPTPRKIISPSTKLPPGLRKVLPTTVKRAGAGLKTGLFVGGAARIGGAKLIGAPKPQPTPRVTRVGIIEEPFAQDSTIIDTPPGARDDPFVIEEPIIDTGRKDRPAVDILERPDFGPIGEPVTTPKPIPTPTPDVSPFPFPRPTPGPTPDVTPFPFPKPTPIPVPRPDFIPIPSPKPRPTPTPTPDIPGFPSPKPTPTPRPDVFPFPKPKPRPDPTTTPFPFPKPRPRPTEEPRPKPRPLPIFGRIISGRKIPVVPFPRREQKRRKIRRGVDRFGRKRFVNPLAEFEDVLGVGSRRTRKQGKSRKSLGNLNFF